MNSNSLSLQLAKEFLGREVEVVIDRPLNSWHPKHGFKYQVNYGYLKGVRAPDGEDLDVYYLGVDEPISKAKGSVIAIVHRLDDDDDKLVVVPKGIKLIDEEIERQIKFQEQWFKHQILRA